MAYKNLLTSLENHILVITINRPEKLNALNKEVFEELDQVLEEVDNDSEIKAAIVTGSGQKAFVAGADITEFEGLSKQQAIALSKKGQATFFKIENSPKPIVAAVNGFALGGGCELAMACHFRIASETAKFGQPEVNLGLIPGYGGTQRLTQLIGKGRAIELLISGAMIDAATAAAYGLVNKVVAPDDLLNKTIEILTLINSKAPIAVAKCIQCANIAASPLAVEAGEDGFTLEAAAFGDCFDTDDKTEGTKAFAEKRKPQFKGR